MFSPKDGQNPARFLHPGLPADPVRIWKEKRLSRELVRRTAWKWRGFTTFTVLNGFFMIKTGNPVISIYTEMTPNPETMKFVANKLLYPGKIIDFPDVESAKPSPLAIELFGFPFVKSVFIASNFVTLTKTTDTDWDDVIPAIRQFLREYLEESKPVVNEEDVDNRFTFLQIFPEELADSRNDVIPIGVSCFGQCHKVAGDKYALDKRKTEKLDCQWRRFG